MLEFLYNKFKIYNPLSVTLLIILLILILVTVWSVVHYNAQPGTPVSVFKLITYNKDPGSDPLRTENNNLKKIIQKLESEGDSDSESLKRKIKELENEIVNHKKFIDKVVADRQDLTKKLTEKIKHIIEIESHQKYNKKAELNTERDRKIENSKNIVDSLPPKDEIQKPYIISGLLETGIYADSRTKLRINTELFYHNNGKVSIKYPNGQETNVSIKKGESIARSFNSGGKVYTVFIGHMNSDNIFYEIHEVNFSMLKE